MASITTQNIGAAMASIAQQQTHAQPREATPTTPNSAQLTQATRAAAEKDGERGSRMSQAAERRAIQRGTPRTEHSARENPEEELGSEEAAQSDPGHELPRPDGARRLKTVA